MPDRLTGTHALNPSQEAFNMISEGMLTFLLLKNTIKCIYILQSVHIDRYI